MQIKNLKKLFEAKVNNRSSPRSVMADKFETETEFESEEHEATENDIKVKIFDRFSIILQIFARRGSILGTQRKPTLRNCRSSSTF